MSLLPTFPRPSVGRRMALLLAAAGAVTVAAAIAIAPPGQQGPSSGSTSNARERVERLAQDQRAGQPPATKSTTGTPAAPDEAGEAAGGVGAPSGVGAAVEDAAVAPSPGREGIALEEAPLPAVELGVKVLQNGVMTVTYPKGGLDDGYAHVTRTTRAIGGYVVGASRSEPAGDRARSATLTIRVPNRKFDEAVDRLSKGGKVTELEVMSEDVTQEYVDARSRLRHNQAVESRLLRLLGRANSVADALVIQDRLSSVQQQIEMEKGRIRYLDKMTQLATLELVLQERGKQAPGERGGEWGLGKALDEAAHRFVERVSSGIVAFGGALPVLLALVAAALLGRRLWRRTKPTPGAPAADSGAPDPSAT